MRRGPQPAGGRETSINPFTFNFQILLLNKEVNLEAVQLIRGAATWVMDPSINSRSLRVLLTTLSPLQEEITRGFSVAIASFRVDCSCPDEDSRDETSDDEDSDDGSYDEDPQDHPRSCTRGLKFLYHVLKTSGMMQPHELTLRLHYGYGIRHSDERYTNRTEWHTRVFDGIADDGSSHSPFPPRFVQAVLDSDFSLPALLENCIIRTTHDRLSSERLTRMVFQHDGVIEKMRPYFAQPAEILLRFFDMYLTDDEIEQWDVILDWPAGAKILSMCVTKQKPPPSGLESQERNKIANG